MKKRTAKNVFFKTKEEASRFIELYGGFCDFYDTVGSTIIFGDCVSGLYEVYIRNTKDEFNEIASAIGLKKKRGNNKKFNNRNQYSWYLFEG